MKGNEYLVSGERKKQNTSWFGFFTPFFWPAQDWPATRQTTASTVESHDSWQTTSQAWIRIHKRATFKNLATELPFDTHVFET